MNRLRTAVRIIVLAVVGASLGGCIVLPYGGRGHHDHGDGGYHAR